MEVLLDDHKSDIILLQETKLNETILNSELFPPGYSILNRRDRNEHGGGVLIAASENIIALPCPDLNTDISDCVWINMLV